MAGKGKRDLKKVINYLAGEVIGECIAQMSFNKAEEKEEAIKNIVIEAMKLRTDLVTRVNRFKKTDDAKSYFKALEKDVFEGVDGLFNKLFEVVKA